MMQYFDQAYLADFADKLVAIQHNDLGFRLTGTESGRRAADLIAAEMRHLGLASVRQEAFPVHAWDFQGASLDLHAPPKMSFKATSFAASVGTPGAGLTATVVDVGPGTAQEYLGKNVRGQIVLVHFDFDKLPWLGSVAHEAELHGAVGVVVYYINGKAQHESGQALNVEDGFLRQTIPIIHLCRNDGEILAGQLAHGAVEATLHCHVTNNPQATGYNVIGSIPGTLYPDRYILIQAHYDAWFYGYWDNAIGVAGVLTIAKAILASGYQPRYTLLFVSPDAEEFGQPDSAYGWLYGSQKLLQAHPEWVGHLTCAFNIDTLAHRWQQGIQFVGCAEMLPFMRQVMAGYEVQHFPLKTVGVAEQITPWTEVYNYVYFGIPTIQPRFKTEGDAIRKLLYHTQFDDASVVDLAKAAEILQLYGHLLLQLDQQPIVPYNLTARAEMMEQSLHGVDLVTVLGAEATAWQETFMAFKEWAAALDLRQNLTPALSYIGEGVKSPDLTPALSYLGEGDKTPDLTPALSYLGEGDKTPDLTPALSYVGEGVSVDQAEAFNNYLGQVVQQLITASYYVETDFPDLTHFEHFLWQREWAALDKAIGALQAGQAAAAIDALTAQHVGVQGGWYALQVSYPVYHRHIRQSDLTDWLWAEGRVILLHDVWIELHHLQDKLARGVTNFNPEITALSRKRATALAGYQASLKRLQAVLQQVMQLETYKV